MYGDFSSNGFDQQANVDGVLHQQGRVLTDKDWNEQTSIGDRWQRAAASAVIGEHVAGIPAGDSGRSARGAGDGRRRPGRSRGQPRPGVGGRPARPPALLDRNDQTAPERRQATYLTAPADGAAPGTPGTRDAVVLELWREALNGFQVPHRLIEPALGGVDTTERIWHGLAFRLLRLGPAQGCDDLGDRLRDDRSARRRLSVSLAPTEISEGDCPVVEGGGYSGFEHDLYRVEIADVASGGPMFKWSRANGGLTGRGTFDAVTRKLTIRANRQPILRSGLQSFYLEAFEPLPQRPPQPATPDAERTADLAEEWRLVYGGRAVLASDEEIDLTQDLFGAIPGPPGRQYFFRLWDDVRAVADFAGGAPVELRDGIRLRFEGAGPTLPGDYWTFPVRAGDVGNPEVLIDDQPPEGPDRFRVPLGVLRWRAGGRVRHDAHEIEDCRRVFQPLTDPAPGCCVAVAPGEDVARAVRRLLRRGGGCLCLLPGEHVLREPLALKGTADVCIEGCGLSSRLVAGAELRGASMFDLAGAADATFRSFAIVQRSAACVFECSGTHGLTLEDMLVVSRVEPGARPPIELRDADCAGWRIHGCVLVGASCLRGLRLQASRITGSTFAAVERGIDLSDLLDVAIADNRFLSVPASAGEELEKLLGSAGSAGAVRRLLDQLQRSAGESLDSRFVALRASGMLDVEIEDNLITGRAGVLGEIVENAVVDGNRFLTSAIGTSIGLAEDVRFSDNRVGQARSEGEGPVAARRAAPARRHHRPARAGQPLPRRRRRHRVRERPGR